MTTDTDIRASLIESWGKRRDANVDIAEFYSDAERYIKMAEMCKLVVDMLLDQQDYSDVHDALLCSVESSGAHHAHLAIALELFDEEIDYYRRQHAEVVMS